jgi:hypothetical protein
VPRSVHHGAALILIAVAGGYLFAALLSRQGFLAHDGLDGYLRTQQYLKELRSGHIPPQLFPDGISGGGYAFPRFYPPLAYLVAAFLAWATGDVVLGYHLALFISVLASGWAMYFAITVLIEEPAFALFAALAYVSFPYRVTDVLQRAALAEAWTFVWYPLVFAGAWRVIKGHRVPAYLPLSVAGMVLTHPTTALYAWCLFLAIGLLARRHVTRRDALRLVAAGLAGIGLTVWFLLPQIHDIETVWAGDPKFMWATPAFAHANRMTIPMLLDYFAAPNGLHLGIGVIGFAMVPVAIGSLLILKNKAPVIDRRLFRLGLALVVSWFGLVAFTISPYPALRVLPTAFAYIQFPWRLLGLCGFIACTATVLLIAAAARSDYVRIGVVVAGVILVGAIPSERRDVMRRPEWTSQSVTDIAKGPYSVKGYTVLAEYLPREAPIEQINERVLAGPKGTTGIEVVSWRRSGSDWVVAVNAVQAGDLTLPLIYYDVYSIGEGKETVPYRSDRGLVALSLSGGTHHLRVTRRLPLINCVAITISSLTVLLTFMLRYRGFSRRVRRRIRPARSRSQSGF